MLELSLHELPQGQTYEDRYQGYIKFFKQIAFTSQSEAVVVHGAPYSWVPLLYHLNCYLERPRVAFDTCHAVKGAWKEMTLASQIGKDFPGITRSMIEVLCTFRPETVDALWKCDMQWPDAGKRTREYPNQNEFPVTCNGSFHRNEIVQYLRHLYAYKPTKRKVVLVPCAADKPYPALLHKRVLDHMPDDYYMMNATGVVGLVPQDMWDIMPHYDSGVPNEWRLMNAVMRYFLAHPHDRIVIFCDYYTLAIKRGLQLIGQFDHRTVSVNPAQFYYDYLPLHEDEYIAQLAAALGTPFKPMQEGGASLNVSMQG